MKPLAILLLLMLAGCTMFMQDSILYCHGNNDPHNPVCRW